MVEILFVDMEPIIEKWHNGEISYIEFKKRIKKIFHTYWEEDENWLYWNFPPTVFKEGD